MVSRRLFTQAAAGAAAGMILTACGPKRLYEAPKDQLKTRIAEMERRYKEQLGQNITVSEQGPLAGVHFAYALDISRCIGCRRCVNACVKENNQSRDPQIHWIKVLSMEKDKGVDFAHADPYYQPATVPEEGHFYVPVQCQQCENPPCVKVCPVHATWQEEDGITVVDYDWCIGCRYCEAACPYWARRFNFTKPSIPKDRLNPHMAYLGNRPRRQGVMEKCHFCIQRSRAGRYPACLEVCPAGARKFGNILDPNSEVSYILKSKRVFIQLKEEMGTSPRFFYYFDV